MTEEKQIEYPPYMLGDDPFQLKARLRKTYARISMQVDANVALQKERIDALRWCRANGNPHTASQPEPQQPKPQDP